MPKKNKFKKIALVLCDNQSLNHDQVNYLFGLFQKLFGYDYPYDSSEILTVMLERSQKNSNMISGLKDGYAILTQNLRSLIKKAHATNQEFLKKLEKFYELCNVEFQRLVVTHKTVREIALVLCDNQSLNLEQIECLFRSFQKIHECGYPYDFLEISDIIIDHLRYDASLKLKNIQIPLQNLRSLAKKARAKNLGCYKKIDELYIHCNLKFCRLVQRMFRRYQFKYAIKILCDEQSLKPDQVEHLLQLFQHAYEDGYSYDFLEIFLTVILEGSQNNSDIFSAFEDDHIILTQNLRSLAKKARAKNLGCYKKIDELYIHCNLKFCRLVQNHKPRSSRVD